MPRPLPAGPRPNLWAPAPGPTSSPRPAPFPAPPWPAGPRPLPRWVPPRPLGPAPGPTPAPPRSRSAGFSGPPPCVTGRGPGPEGGLLRTPRAPGWRMERDLGGAPVTERRGVRRAPSRKRKLGGRAKRGRESAAVDSFYREVLLHSVWASLRLREMVRSGSRPGQVRAAHLRRPLGAGRGTEGALGPGEVQNCLKKIKTKTARPQWKCWERDGGGHLVLASRHSRPGR